MPDRLFSDPNLAELYDLFSPPCKRRDFSFYLPLIMSSDAVLDVGCGTGALLHMARNEGHTGQLCGIDPAPGMLEQARRRTDIDWILGDLASVSWERKFDLIVMTGHAFQVFVEDDELRNTLAAVHHALSDNGYFAFETRNPSAKAWERWHTEYSGEATDQTGAIIRTECKVEKPVKEGIVNFSHTFTSASWEQAEVSHSTLRFLSADSLRLFLSKAGLEVEQQYGNWNRSSLTNSSPEIITIARRVVP